MNPKFKIDDIVFYDNKFSFNPVEDVLSVGKIVGIHIKHGKSMFKNTIIENKIVYTISGSNLLKNEKEREKHD